MLLYNNRIVFDCSNNHKYTYNFDELSDLGIIGQMVIAFATTDRQAYEIKSSYPRSALKYREVLKNLRAK